ncbi:DUF427 domain-containing protein [Marinobacterium aestuariivivens]|uniref:DUF427 domain-containing protein n=1 Tax=Marinobacterium aestuariivivens TaxID=1698799 RepID=A0ABW2A9Y5_9GAMM
MTTASSYGAYQICFEPCDARISVEFNGRLVADSSRVMVLRETGLPATYYFPREDVRMDWLRPSEHHTHCPFKGNASYWTLEVAGKCAENAVWSYEDPYDEAAQVRNYVAFYWGRMDAWYRNGQRQAEPAVSDRTANPYLGWLLRDAWQAYEAGQLVESFAGRLVDGKLPLQRFGLLIRTLHPQLFAVSYQWQRDRAGVREIQQSHDLLLRSEYLDSPYAPILQGVGGVRRRLEGEDCQLDFPVLRELRDSGATDYVAMPLLFSDGQINIITLVSDRRGGFTTSELGHIHEILPLLSRLFEVQALKRTAQVLLETYLGGYTGPRVLGG